VNISQLDGRLSLVCTHVTYSLTYDTVRDFLSGVGLFINLKRGAQRFFAGVHFQKYSKFSTYFCRTKFQ